MKTLLTIALLAAAMSVAGQVKKSKSSHRPTLFNSRDVVTISDTSLSKHLFGRTKVSFVVDHDPIGLFVWSVDKPKPILMIDNPHNGWNNPIDSLVIHVDRKRTKWLNDSTLIIVK